MRLSRGFFFHGEKEDEKTCRLDRSCISGRICYSFLFSAFWTLWKASFFLTSRHSLILLDSKLLPAPSLSHHPFFDLSAPYFSKAFCALGSYELVLSAYGLGPYLCGFLSPECTI